MRLWTVQPKVVLDEIYDNGVFHCDPLNPYVFCGFNNEEDYEGSLHIRNAYYWLANEMKLRVGQPAENVILPIWAWYTYNGRHRAMDLRREPFRDNHGSYRLTLDIDACRVLLSDEIKWHHVLNYWECYDSDDEYDEIKKHTENQIRESWVKVFNLTYNRMPSKYIQATFWEIHKDDIVNVRKIP